MRFFTQVNNIKWLSLSIFVLFIDQLTKFLALHFFSFSHSYPIIPFLNMTLVENTGAAFSFLSFASGWQNTFFIWVGIIICFFILIWMSQTVQRDRIVLIGLSLVFGGAVGNLCDRFRFGYVVDFIDFYIRHWHWPVFNLADTAICIGVGLLMIDTVVQHR